MNKKLTGVQLIGIASMLFGMFFGAGNLIFPIFLGQLAAENVVGAIIGFLVTGVGLPLLGVAAIGKSYSNGLYELSAKVSRGYGLFFTCALYLTIGPFFAIPRCATLSFDTGIKPMFGDVSKLWLVIFSGVFFLIVLGFSLYPGKIMTWIGKILNPVFLVFLGVLIVTALIFPMGNTFSASAVGDYQSKAFFTGFLEGYNTMDALAGLAFGIIVVDVIRSFGIKEPSDVAKNTVKAGILSCLAMGLIYAAVAIVGAQSRGVFEVCENGAEVFSVVAKHYFGSAGAVILAFTVTLACLKTAVGLVTSCSETFVTLFPRALSYKAWAVIFSIGSFLVANLGLNSIIEFAKPVLMFLYPLAITLILLGLFGKSFGNAKCVYVSVTSFTFAAALLELMWAIPENTPGALCVSSFAYNLKQVIPLAEFGLGWMSFAIVGLFVGLAIKLAKGKKA